MAHSYFRANTARFSNMRGGTSDAKANPPEVIAVMALLTAVLFGYGYFIWQRKAPIKRGGRFRHLLADINQVTTTSTPFHSTAAAYSLQRAVNSFALFGSLSQSEIDAKWLSFQTLRSKHRELGETIGYTEKLTALEDATKKNALFTKAITSFAEKELFALPTDTDGADLSRAREALKHLVRDWSDDGKDERENTISPILTYIRSTIPSSQYPDTKVLVPGCGLGRLAWEISELGLDVTAVEYSHFMTLPFRFLSSKRTTQKPYQHTIHPYTFNLSHQRSASSLLRPVKLPDVVPHPSDRFNLLEADFLTLPTADKYNVVVTLFFIDTAVNIADYLQQIYDLLLPGGTWINLGPLLWTPGSVAKMELDLHEVIELAKLIGFEIDMTPRTIGTEYTSNTEGMMRWVYETQMWTATKPRPIPPVTPKPVTKTYKRFA